MASSKNVLILCGDYMEDYEVAVPFYALSALGVRVNCAAPGKSAGDPCITAVHEFLGYDLYTELPGHRFTLTADMPADPASYDVKPRLVPCLFLSFRYVFDREFSEYRR
jgi:D-lactate dehydratase